MFLSDVIYSAHLSFLRLPLASCSAGNFDMGTVTYLSDHNQVNTFLRTTKRCINNVFDHFSLMSFQPMILTWRPDPNCRLPHYPISFNTPPHAISRDKYYFSCLPSLPSRRVEFSLTGDILLSDVNIELGISRKTVIVTCAEATSGRGKQGEIQQKVQGQVYLNSPSSCSVMEKHFEMPFQINPNVIRSSPRPS